jgi:hypothetical protein
MNKRTPVLGVLTLLAVVCASGQGTFVYDQQSSSDEIPPPGYWGDSLQHESQSNGGCGQSFTPNLPGVDFVKFMFQGLNIPNQAGTKVFVNLRSGSITGPILGVTAPVIMPAAFVGPATFFIPNTVTVTPGVTYYFEVVPPLHANLPFDSPIAIRGSTFYNYAGGMAFGNTHPAAYADLWFREGVVVPEPSSVTLMLLGACAFWCVRPIR